jgi:hypothetical protein
MFTHTQWHFQHVRKENDGIGMVLAFSIQHQHENAIKRVQKFTQLKGGRREGGDEKKNIING